MNYDKIRIPLEISLGREINELIQGDVIEQVIKDAQIEKIENNWKYILEGHSFKLGPQMAPDLYSLCKNVQEELDFKESIDFYITNSADLNAFSLARSHDDTNHIINLNSALVEKFDNDELRFVVGHEIGHLISGNTRIAMLVQFVYPQGASMPLMLQHKLNLWNKVSELTADRFGYLVCQKSEKTLSSFFKLSSGLSAKRVMFNPVLYSKENEKTLAFFKENARVDILSHPINPIRVKAIELFAKSETYAERGLSNGDDEALNTDMDELISILIKTGSSALDYHRKIFIATAGIILAQVDDGMNEDEYREIITALSEFSMFPKEFLFDIAQKDVVRFCNQAISEILEINPSEKYALIDFIIRIALSDHDIFKGELDLIYHFGENLMMSKKEVAQIIATSIQKQYVPNIFKQLENAK
nr:M48 family metallopeptidase [uncultured Marinifilum sp.]